MKLQEAQAEHPSAWFAIQQRMAELERTTDAALVPFAAEIVTDRGERVLRLLCHSDMIPAGSDVDGSVMIFQAPLDGMPTDAAIH